MKTTLYFIIVTLTLIGCSKSSDSSSIVTGGNPTGLFPLALNNQWSYKLKDYNTSTGAVIDSSNFTLTITGQASANGATYYKLLNSLNNGVLWMANLSSTTIGSIDSVNGVTYFTFFVAGTGDSTQSISSWPVTVSGSCTGTEKLYAYYADTTLVNLDGTTYANAKKNDAVIYDCSSKKYEAQVYFIKQGIGLVRYSQYTYDASGNYHLQLAWILNSYTLH